MSQAKHTPGPWVWTPESESIHGYSPEGEALVVVYELNTNEADARLIAAAPTMYSYIETKALNGDDEAKQILETIHASR